MSKDTSSAELSAQELQKRIDAFADSIGVETKVVKEKLAEEGICVDKPEQAITILDNEDYLPFADLAKQFLDTNLTKKAPLRLGISHLRGKTTLSEPSNGNEIGELVHVMKDMVKDNRPISNWGDKELLDAYDNASPKIWKELNDRAHGRCCVVFLKNGDIDVEASFSVLKIAKRQTTTDKMRIDGGELRRVYRAGKFIEKPLDASPFYVDTPLVGDYCSQSDTDWKGISHKRRVIVRLHVTEIEPEKKELGHITLKQIYNDARKLNDDEFARDYGHAHLLYEEMEEEKKLPTLKVMRGVKKQNKIDKGF